MPQSCQICILEFYYINISFRPALSLGGDGHLLVFVERLCVFSVVSYTRTKLSDWNETSKYVTSHPFWETVLKD